MTPVEKSAYREIRDRFGRPSVDVFTEDSWRVIIWDSKAHRGASCGQLVGHGSTFLKACQDLLDKAGKSQSVTINAPCRLCEQSCCY